MDWLDKPLSDREKTVVEYLKAFGLIMALNLCTKWAASGVVLLTKGFYDIMTVSNIGATKMRLDISFALCYILFLIVSAIFVNSRRSKFSWGDAEAEWDKEKYKYCFRHLFAYTVYSLPGDIYFLIVGTDKVFHPEKWSASMSLTGETGYEPWWLSFFFTPQITFFRLTESVFLGIILGLFFYYAMMIFLCLKKPKKTVNN